MKSIMYSSFCIAILLVACQPSPEGVAEQAIATYQAGLSSTSTSTSTSTQDTARPLPTLVGHKTPTLEPTPTLPASPTPVPRYKRPCVSYYDQKRVQLKFACQKNDGYWTIEIVLENGSIYGRHALTFDNTFSPHVAFRDDDQHSVKLLSRINGEWVNEEIAERPAFTDEHISMAFANDNTPYISFLGHSSGGNNAIKLAFRDASGWMVQDVEIVKGKSSSNPFIYPSVGLINGNEPVVCYRGLDDSLNCSLWRNGAWEKNVIDSSGTSWISPLAVDNRGQIGIVYIEGKSGDVKYAHWDGAKWNLEYIETGEMVGSYPILAFDHENRPHVVYYDRSQSTMYEGVEYAKIHYAFHDGNKWQVQPLKLGNGLSEGDYSIAVDPTGKVYLVYYDGDQGLIKMAIGGSGGWQISVVDQVEHVMEGAIKAPYPVVALEYGY